jgi:cobalamin biosynthesis protein CobT
VTASDKAGDSYRATTSDALRGEIAKALSSAARVAHGLRLLLDTSARDSREGGRKNGRLDMSALARIACGSESVFEKRTYQDGIDAAVTILIDQSVSMNAHGRYRAARTMAGALAKIVSGCAGVRCEILGFHSGDGQGAMHSPTESIIGEIGTDEDREDWFAMRHDCCITVYKTFAESYAKGWRAQPATGERGRPTRQPRYAASRLAREPAGRKFLLVIADGEGSTKEVLGRILQRVERDGVTAIGIGIEQSMNEAYAHRAIVNDVSKLHESGLGALLTALSRGDVAQAIRNGAD